MEAAVFYDNLNILILIIQETYLHSFCKGNIYEQNAFLNLPVQPCFLHVREFLALAKEFG